MIVTQFREIQAFIEAGKAKCVWTAEDMPCGYTEIARSRGKIGGRPCITRRLLLGDDGKLYVTQVIIFDDGKP